MKKLFTFLIAIILIGNFSFAQKAVNKDGNYENLIRIKLSEQLSKEMSNAHQKSSNTINRIKANADGTVQTNIQSLDVKNSEYSAVEYKRVFRYAGKFEQKHKEFGLHQWYDISFNSKSSVKELIKAYSEIEDVIYALPISEKSLTDHPKKSSAKSLSGAPNDPRFSDQWHYENTGQNNGTPGADISLLQAWELETGNSNVIVAIEDQGVDFDHPDLAGNMWINTGEIAGNGYDDDNNGYVDDIYGYNFGDGQGTITPGDHGTHVGGTVAAETNNGIGVSGIAGGTGNNDGVRIMSCEVFGTSSQGGFAEAFVYAADMGAHISQNSWGGGGEDQSINAAIDYFIANGGSAGSPMQGGVVIIAAGNDNTSSGASIWPAAYVNAIAVAATNKNDEKSYYSNYGTWVDISAPGGELESSNNDPTAIHSTYNNGGYGVMQGTSMACPHVSGVAALIVSKFSGSITPSEVRSKLIDNTDNIDASTSGYIGQMGSGRLNAYASLTGSTPPTTGYCTSKGDDFSYEWIAQVEVGSFSKTSNGSAYSDFTSDVIDVNSGQSYNITLTPGFASSSYNEYWKIWIDFDNDTTFDAGELVFDAGALSKTAVSGTINIPTGVSGLRRMRVSMKYNGAQDACETFDYGEVEDYHVNISSGGDTQAPTAPTGLASSNITKTSVSLNWNASTDNVGVTGYNVYQNGSSIGSVTGTSANVTGLTASTTYSFYVKAKDAAGNISSASNSIDVTTLSDGIACFNTVSSYPYSESFESGLGYWLQGSSDDIDWTRDASGTPSSSTGPSSASEGSYYMYVEASSPNYPSKTAILNSPCFDLSVENSAIFEFDYHMYGSSMGTLELQATTDGTSWNTIWSKTGDQGNTWLTASINLSSYLGEIVKLRFYGTTGSSYTSDMTVDNIILSNGGGSDTQAPTAPTGLASSNITETSFTLSWNASSDNVGVTAYDVYQDGSLLGSVSGTSANITGLSTSTTYSMSVKAKDAAGNVSAMSSSLNVTTTGEVLTYCDSKGNNVNYEWIDLVQLNEIDNATGSNGGYADFTNMTANVTPGSSQTIYISCGFASSSYTEYWHVWIDWDQSGTFDSDEEMISGSSSSDATLSATFTVPSDALLGSTRMRVTMKYNSAATACETFSYGEVEDYTINVTNTSMNSNFAPKTSDVLGNEESTRVLVYPNPATHQIIVDIVNRSESATVNIYNVIGSLVKVVEMTENQREINIEDLPAGSYIISVEDEKEPIVKQFIKR